MGGFFFFWSLSPPLSLFEVHVDSTAVLMRDLGVSGFQVPLLWEGRWVTGLMNSDGRQLLINQETVCQWARRKTAAPAARTEIHTDLKNTQQAQRSAPGHADAPTTAAHTRTHNAIHISFISVPCAFCWAEANPVFPPWRCEQDVPITYVLTPSPPGPSSSLDMETPARCKFWMSPGEQKVQEIKAEAADLHPLRRQRLSLLSGFLKLGAVVGGKKKKTKRKETHFSCHPFVSSPQAFHFAALYSRLQKTRWLTLRKSEWVSVLFIIFPFHVQLQNNCGSACKRRTKGYHGNVCSPAMAAEPHRNIAQWRSYRPQARGICFHFIADSRNSRGKKDNKKYFLLFCLCWLYGCRLRRVSLLFLFGGADWFDNFGVTNMDDIDRLQCASLPLIFKNSNNQQKKTCNTSQNKKEFLKAVKYTEILHCSHSPEQWHPVIYQM